MYKYIIYIYIHVDTMALFTMIHKQEAQPTSENGKTHCRVRAWKVCMSCTPLPTTRLANGQPAINRQVASLMCEEACYGPQPRTAYQI